MNLLTPDQRNVLHHADIETGKIVSTWTFKKDGVELNMEVRGGGRVCTAVLLC